MTLPREVAYRLDPAAWVHHELGVAPKPWQAQFLRAPRGSSIAILTFAPMRQTTCCGVGHGPHVMFKVGSLSVGGLSEPLSAPFKVRKPAPG